MRRKRDPKFSKRIEKAIKRSNIFELLETLGVKYKQQGGYGDLWLKCFLSAHRGGARPSLHIMANPIHQYFGFWKCFGCGASGSVIEFVKIIRDTTFTDALSIVEAHQRSEIDEEDVNWICIKPAPKMPIFVNVPEVESEWNKEYLEYLYNRGINWWQIQKHHIGYCDTGKYSNRVIIPVTLGKEFCTFIARSILNLDEHPNVQRVTSARGGLVGLFGSTYADTSMPAIVSEGWADKLAIERVGYKNTYALQRNELHARQAAYLKRFPYTIYVPDGDDGGNHLIDSLAPYIDDMKIYIAKIPWGKDPAECTESELETAIGNAEEWNPSEEEIKVEIEY